MYLTNINIIMNSKSQMLHSDTLLLQGANSIPKTSFLGLWTAFLRYFALNLGHRMRNLGFLMSLLGLLLSKMRCVNAIYGVVCIIFGVFGVFTSNYFASANKKRTGCGLSVLILYCSC